MQLIGERVRKYRRQKGFSQEQLGEMVHFSQSKISKIERGDWDSLSDLRLIVAVDERS
jgi:transcriptional regulator with XRE-family HTH domain